MVLLNPLLATVGAAKPIFLDSGFPRKEERGGGCAWAWFVITV